MTEITSTKEMAEREWDGESEPEEVESDIVATTEPEGRGIEFHVSLRNYTMHDMEDLIVDAAAGLIVGQHNETSLARMIEAKCIALLDAKATSALEKVTTEIIDQPLTPSCGNTPPVTMREFIGLYAREYLTQKVDSNGQPTSSRYGSGTRIEYLAGRG